MDGNAPHPAPLTPSPEDLQHLYQLVVGYRASQALYVVAKLGIADLLADGPRPTEELAQATQTHAPTLFRVLRFLAGLGIFAEGDRRRFALTPLGAGLSRDVAGSPGALALLLLDGSHWRGWGELLHSVRTGESAFAHVHGQGYFPYVREHPELAAIFDRAMTSNAAMAGVAITSRYDWANIARVVDVGGGHGWLLATVLQAHPAMQGVLFDRPEVVAAARPVLEEAGVADRCELVGGDFFSAVPPQGDAYVLRHILHDWDDAPAQVILERCRQAMAPRGRVLVVERVVGTEYREAMPALQGDLEMLVNVGGRERTEAEYRALLASAGFQLTHLVPLGDAARYSVVEGVPA
jgi:hypothetical protein